MKHILTLIFVLVVSSLSAQQLTNDMLKDIKPRNIGPGGMSGRVTSIDVVTENPDVMYVGTASGGLWKSTSGGIKWEPIFDNEKTASIGAVAIQQSNPSVIWVGTGEGNPRNSLNGGFGVYKSLDGGKNWMEMGLQNTRHIHRIIIDPTDPNTVYVGAIGSPWGIHPERGVYKTTDGGKTWKKILFQNEKTGVADMVMDPTNPNKLIVAMWEHKRDPWFFNSGGEGSGLFITHDGGETWEERTDADGLPKGELGRIGLAIAPNKPNIVYALVEAKKNALYKSEDGGFNWKKINDKNDIGNRPFYYSDIFVDPENENRVYSVFTYVNVSEDGGNNFKQLMPAYGVDNGVHPDHHAWWIHPTDGSFMMDGNDGGLNITHDGGKSWRFVGNLPVAQFYHINVDNEFPYNVYGGMQDNGSWRGPAYVWKAQGIRNSYWQEISFGDGFDVVPDRDDSRYGWSMSQQGFVSRYDWKTGNNYTVKPTHPDPEVFLRFNWNSAINIDPFDTSTIYFGSQFVHKSTNKGLTWEVISPDLTTNDPEKQKQSESGGLTMDATGAENHTTILVIEPSPLEQNMLWAGTDDGRVHYTQNGGQSWTDVSKNLPGLPEGSWIVQIKASNKNKGEALLVANDYRRFNYTPYAYRTTNYGKTWNRIVDENDVESYTLSIVEDPKEKNLLFLGTDDGLYVSTNAGSDWMKWTNGFPTVSVKDLVIQEREDDLVIGTFGRSAWVLDDIKPLREIAKNSSVFNETIKVFDPPTAYQAAYQQPTGSRFGGDALYNAENRAGGARIRYYFNAPEDEKDSEEKDANEDDSSTGTEAQDDDDMEDSKPSKDSIYMKIYDGTKLIRTLKQKKPDSTGIYTWHWRMDEAGVDRPSRKIQKRKSEPRGTQVKPGTYRIDMEFDGNTTTTTVKVESDPRLDIPQQAIIDSYNASKDLEKMTQTAADAVKQLVESKNSAEDFSKKLSKEDKKRYKEEIKASKEIVKQIDSVIAFFIGKEDKRQGITRNPEITVMQRIGQANWYSGSRPNGLTKTERTLIQQAEDELQSALQKTNAFFNKEWAAYRTRMENITLDRFKETKTFTLEK
ncbi:VPS10 domain-containing protein [Marinirhabdus gelatinilytica]|uniref:Photosystem II stability/assembly factor-like uncharacterized protein n=1 Tax=Marinirhabdus gelatinilytica TaxID=1703343 RepID=A0A370QGC9_9FLAO|nr:hypothetical protein [Marinirhabdus gelatinilytica]RDK87110.1 photosystem II stability/assembly factor-like uncharacterized protein [Marinirhabdus gelatinilytica]